MGSKRSMAFEVVAIVCWLMSFDAAAFAPDDARVLSADPNRPAVGLAYRGSARATLGSPIRPLSSAAGLQVALVPLVELQNRPGSSEPVPFESWRGRLELYGGWRLVRSRNVATVWLGTEHESDHPTLWQAPYPTTTYFTLNSIGARGELTSTLGRVALTSMLIERLYVDVCTAVAPPCRRAFGDGSRAFEQGVEVVIDHTDVDRAVRPFGAIALSARTPSGRAASARRLVINVGARLRQPTVGLWQAYLVGLFGNDVGIYGQEPGVQFGGGVAFSF
jgi:hypothetical protein